MKIEDCVATNLKKFRHENGLTQSELAEISGLSFKYIYKLESGLGNPSIKILNILSKSLGVSIIKFFLDESGNKVDFE